MLTILRSVEELLYEVMSWLLFYPRTLWMTLTRPLHTMRYSDQQQRDKPEKQYLDTLSPPLFLVLSILLAHAVELGVGVTVERGGSALAQAVSQNEQTLLAFRALMFSLPALVLAAMALALDGKRMDRETLREPFFAQCYSAGAAAIFVSLGGIGIRYPNDVATLGGVVLIGLATVWYVWLQWVWVRRRAGRGAFATTILTLSAYAGAMAAVAAIGLVIP